MIVIRILLVLGGIWLGWYGIDLLLAQNSTDLLSTGRWFLGGIIVHDAVLAPLCAVVAVAARRLLPPRFWPTVAWAAICTLTLTLVALPVLGRSGAVAMNPTVLDRDYPLGFLLAVAVVWLVAGLDLVRRARRKSRAE
ncbi:hypothetical protein AB0C65_31855 [Nocardia sp. NPDC048505]|uniref:hypothetical protein n=1 Tax=Nocardia sp. NPDC048505 TaxID=3155756 RepID=UPI0033EC4A2B